MFTHVQPIHMRMCFLVCVRVCFGWRTVLNDSFSFCSCWMSVETHLLYAVHGPIVAALLVSLQPRCLNISPKKKKERTIRTLSAVF